VCQTLPAYPAAANAIVAKKKEALKKVVSAYPKRPAILVTGAGLQGFTRAHRFQHAGVIIDPSVATGSNLIIFVTHY